jgi:hypothetical protein
VFERKKMLKREEIFFFENQFRVYMLFGCHHCRAEKIFSKMMTFIPWSFLQEYIRTACENEKRLSLYIKLLSSGEAKFHAL